MCTYRHVNASTSRISTKMGSDSWTLCLQNFRGQRSIGTAFNRCHPKCYTKYRKVGTPTLPTESARSAPACPASSPYSPQAKGWTGASSGKWCGIEKRWTWAQLSKDFSSILWVCKSVAKQKSDAWGMLMPWSGQKEAWVPAWLKMWDEKHELLLLLPQHPKNIVAWSGMLPVYYHLVEAC